jgi:hypothetical protein
VEFPELRDLFDVWPRSGVDDRRGRLPLPHTGARVVRVNPGIIGLAEKARRKGLGSHLPADLDLKPRHVRTGKPLFEHLPALGDINQNQLGDCWFLAALAAIVHAGTGYAIELLMREVVGVGTDACAYVRLWDTALQPLYVEVDTSLLEVEGGVTFHSTGGLWAPVLEKAMTALDEQGNVAPEGAGYVRLWGSPSTRAFRALLGVAAESRAIPAGILSPKMDVALDRVNPGKDLELLYHVLQGDDVPSYVPVDVFAGLIALGRAPLFYTSVWKPWAATTGLGAAWFQSYQLRVFQGSVYRQEHFEQFMRGHAQQHSTQWHASTVTQGQAPTALQAVECVCQWARRTLLFPGKRGSGLYTLEQVRLHDEIAQHLQSHRPLCLGSRKEVGRSTDPEPGASGEPMSKGLAGGHVYAVTGCHTDADTGLRFVQAWNPWGRTGRGYSFTLTDSSLRQLPNGAAVKKAFQRKLTGERIPTAYETESPLFWLELDDVTKRCHDLYTCGPSTPGLILEARKLAGLKS